jgi:CHAT domain-containing protein
LVDRYPVYYLDAATMARFTPKERRLGQDAKILALAEPARANAGLAELPFTVRETEAMRRYFGNVDRRVGGEATESALRDAMASVDVLHVASHGEFLARAPAESRLLLAANSSNDGDLTVGEVFTMETRADMVTLSACESGMGRLSSADEVVGMNRAFFYAGTNTVVSSLWRINDVASAVVMKRFYRYLSEGDDKAEAMRKSQQVVRRYFAHPAYWSAFRVVGDHR